MHDLGGKQGFGAVPVGDDVLFHADWERRAFAVTQFAQGLAGFNTDAFRHGIEREDPATYRRATYFEKWIRNAERMLVEGGVLAPDAVSARVAGRKASGEAARTADALPPQGRGAKRPVDAPPRFTVGDRVVARRRPGSGHTRLPDYAVGRVGTVAIVNGGWVLPDTHAHGEGEQPCWVYAVRFDAADLWPDDTGVIESGHAVHVDLFEPYLDPVSDSASPEVP